MEIRLLAGPKDPVQAARKAEIVSGNPVAAADPRRGNRVQVHCTGGAPENHEPARQFAVVRDRLIAAGERYGKGWTLPREVMATDRDTEAATRETRRVPSLSGMVGLSAASPDFMVRLPA